LGIDGREARSTRECVGSWNVDELTAGDRDGRAVHVRGLAALGVVHQRVGALDELGRELARDAAAFLHGAEPEAHHADIHLHRTRRQPAIFARPVVLLDGRLEAPGDLDRLMTTRQIGDEEAELVAAEPGVQVAALGAALHGQEIRERI